MPRAKKHGEVFPGKSYGGPIWTHMKQLRERQDRMAEGLEKLAMMVQVLSTAYSRIIERAQASAAVEAEAGVVPETVSEGGIILGGKQP